MVKIFAQVCLNQTKFIHFHYISVPKCKEPTHSCCVVLYLLMRAFYFNCNIVTVYIVTVYIVTVARRLKMIQN